MRMNKQHAWEKWQTHTKYSVGNPEGKRPHRRPESRWEDNIKMDLEEPQFYGHGLDSAGSG
jgi:hypothetical protein